MLCKKCGGEIGATAKVAQPFCLMVWLAILQEEQRRYNLYVHVRGNEATAVDIYSNKLNLDALLCERCEVHIHAFAFVG
jgi:hypothetical protein